MTEQQRNEANLPQILCLKEVCSILRVSRGFVERAARKGELAGFKIGRSWRFDKADVQRWMQAKYRQSQQ